jgi:polyisoprenoid-binding protein YceI
MRNNGTLGHFFLLGCTTLLLAASPAQAEPETYKLDPAHSFIEFRISHLGYSVLKGRFNQMEGSFSHDGTKPDADVISVSVETTSIDSNHAERDKHLRGKDFLDVTAFPKAEFKSGKIQGQGKEVTVEGQLTLHGVTKPITIAAQFIGSGADPWGGYRRGYQGKTNIKRSDFGISKNLGPAAEEMELELFIEGIRQ